MESAQHKSFISSPTSSVTSNDTPPSIIGATVSGAEVHDKSTRSYISTSIPSLNKPLNPALPLPIDLNSSPQNAPVRRTRREKPKLALAPDQPMTTQGKPRARVYVACVQCRNRKIRCDGAKPVCHNCTKRSSSSEDACSYDAMPKRRGPDKLPGARQRIIQEGKINYLVIDIYQTI